MIAWYDNIPLLSWLLLQGKCRSCNSNISWLYPFIEAATAIILSCLYVYIPHHYFFAYFICISALLVTFRSDAETMLISRYMTLCLVPVSWMFSYFGLLPITVSESMFSAFFGHFFLFSINYMFKKYSQKDGIGEGDFDLLCFIGSFSGVLGCWTSLTIGSAIGSLWGISYFVYACYKKENDVVSTKVPFGPYLVMGALIYIFYQKQILSFFCIG